MKVKRPPIHWFGSKWIIARKILPYFPHHTCYVEPYGGGACMLMRKPRAHTEVYNDLDRGLINVFTVLRDPVLSLELQRQAWLTPFARDEFELSYEPSADPVEAARRFIFRAFSSHGSTAHAKSKTGFRSKDRAGRHNANVWANWPSHVPSFCERLRGVVIENRDALEVIGIHDSASTLFYLDPPYVHSTRADKTGLYGFEMSDEDHVRMLEAAQVLHGYVFISGYRSDLYDQHLEHWHRMDFRHYAGGTNSRARARLECVWMNQKASDATLPLFQV